MLAFLGMAPIGNLVAGALADRLGASLTLAVNGAIAAVAAAWFWQRMPTLRKSMRPDYERLGIVAARSRPIIDALSPPLHLATEITMKRRTLPGTELAVSEVCLGTMTWGEQNSEADAHAQLDYAVGAGHQLHRHRRDVSGAAERDDPGPHRDDTSARWLARQPRDQAGHRDQGRRARAPRLDPRAGAPTSRAT